MSTDPKPSEAPLPERSKAPKQRKAPIPKQRKAPTSKQRVLPVDTPLQDNVKKTWVIGDKIGEGGFGTIYIARGADEFVIKVEPTNSGPLYCELNFYIQNAKQNMLQAFMKKHSLTHLAVPKYISCGVVEPNRFMVMDRFGADIDKLMNTTFIPITTILNIGVQLLYALEYIHSKGYVHSDIKPRNIVRGRDPDRNVYLVDYGLVSRYDSTYLKDKCKDHMYTGTLEYCSVNVHAGCAPNRRGDVETLLYTLLDLLARSLFYQKTKKVWSGLTLPWRPPLLKRGKYPKKTWDAIGKLKAQSVSDPDEMIHSTLTHVGCELDDLVSSQKLADYMHHCCSLGNKEMPDYEFLRRCLHEAGATGGTLQW